MLTNVSTGDKIQVSLHHIGRVKSKNTLPALEEGAINVAQPLNEFLRSLPKSDFALLSAALKRVSLKSGDVLGEAGSPLQNVYFPEAGLISVVLELSSGDRIETGLVGRTGMLGAAAAFGALTQVNSVMVQMSGSAYVMKAAELIEAARRSESLRCALFKEEQFMLV